MMLARQVKWLGQRAGSGIAWLGEIDFVFAGCTYKGKRGQLGMVDFSLLMYGVPWWANATW